MEIMFSSLGVKTGCSIYIFRSSQQEERNGRVHFAFWQSVKIGLADLGNQLSLFQLEILDLIAPFDHFGC